MLEILFPLILSVLSPAMQQITQTDLETNVFMIVNGESILRDAYDESFNLWYTVEIDEALLRDQIIDFLISEALIRQASIAMDIIVVTDEIDAEIAHLKAFVNNDDQAWQQWLTENQLNTEFQIRDLLYQQILTAKVRDHVVEEYLTNRPIQQLHARHILVDSQVLALDILQQLQSDADFVDLAARYSLDVTTRDQGGDLGWFTEYDLVAPLVAHVASAQAIGELSDPIATSLGYHIVQTLAFDSAPLPQVKQAEIDQIIFNDWLTIQIDNAVVELDEEENR